MKFLKSSKFYWILSFAFFVILAFVAVFELSLSLQFLLAGLIATSVCVSLIISRLKYKRNGWWVAAISSFWVGFISVILAIMGFFTYTLPIIATVLCLGFAIYAYIEHFRNGPYPLK